MSKYPGCPNPEENPDDCEVCHGWGHLCTAFRATHTAQQVRVAESIYQSGYDPTRFYPSLEACEAGEAEAAKRRRESGAITK